MITQATANSDIATIETALRALLTTHYTDANVHAAYRTNVMRALEQLREIRELMSRDRDHVS